MVPSSLSLTLLSWMIMEVHPLVLNRALLLLYIPLYSEEPPSGIIIEEEGDHLNNAVRSVVPTIHDSNTLGVGGHNDYDHHDTRYVYVSEIVIFTRLYRFNANSSSSSHSFFGWSEKQCRVTVGPYHGYGHESIDR